MKYNILLLDPPWSYDDKCTAGNRGADFKYRTMSTRDLSFLRVGDLAEDNAALFLWATGPFLPDAIKLIRCWGFQYKGVAFNWIKTNPKAGSLFMGMGSYTRSNAEYVLLGMKGKLARQSASVHSVVMNSILKPHSRKPQVVRDRIVELFGNLPRVEFFARKGDEDNGWVQTGLEMDGKDVRDFIDEESPVGDVVKILKSRT